MFKLLASTAVAIVLLSTPVSAGDSVTDHVLLESLDPLESAHSDQSDAFRIEWLARQNWKAKRTRESREENYNPFREPEIIPSPTRARQELDRRLASERRQEWERRREWDRTREIERRQEWVRRKKMECRARRFQQHNDTPADDVLKLPEDVMKINIGCMLLLPVDAAM